MVARSTNSLAYLASAAILSQAAALGIRPKLSRDCKAHKTARRANIDIRIASNAKGLGAFCTSPIKMGEYIGEYSGEKLTLNQVQTRFWNKGTPSQADEVWAQSRRDRGQGITGSYVFEMRDGSFVDAEDAEVSGWCRFMNHATEGDSDCNVKAFDRLEADGDLLSFPQFYAIRDIEVGEELSWDYGPLRGL